jgi:sugar phosphate isomerase/epimerase
MIAPCQVVPSTTSHKKEALLTTLEIFGRLGMHDLDLNLNHMIERGEQPDRIKTALAAHDQHVRIISGGWCDFFHAEPRIHDTLASVERQIRLARLFEADRMRLFFGRLPLEACSPGAVAIAAANIRRVADAHSDLLFVFENHDGASSSPAVCRDILEAADRTNARLNFDPINFEAAGVDSGRAFDVVRHLIAHVHLKGLDDQGFCEFGTGRVDLTATLRALVRGGYRGGFTVEYEGPFDRTARLYESLECARGIIAALLQDQTAPA